MNKIIRLLILLVTVSMFSCLKKKDAPIAPVAKTCKVSKTTLNGDVTSVSVLDGNNRYSEFKLYKTSGELDEVYKYEYNSSGQTTKVSFEKKGEVYEYYTYEYDNNKLSVCHYFKIDISKNAIPYANYKYTYKSGNISKLECFNPSDTTPYNTYNYTTDGIGNVLTEDGKNSHNIYSFYDNKINPIKGQLFGIPQPTYFCPNNYTKMTFDKDIYSLTYEYNSEGYPIKMTMLNPDNTTDIYTYEYTCK